METLFFNCFPSSHRSASDLGAGEACRIMSRPPKDARKGGRRARGAAAAAAVVVVGAGRGGLSEIP